MTDLAILRDLGRFRRILLKLLMWFQFLCEFLTSYHSTLKLLKEAFVLAHYVTASFL